MNICKTLVCFFFFTLWPRNTGLINAEILVAKGNEGGNIIVECNYSFTGKTKIFCKEACEEGDILIKTNDVTATSGRYSIVYEEGTFPVSTTVLNVSITNLTKSDAGKYRCGLHRTLTPFPSYWEVEIRVEEASVPSASTLTTTQCLSFSTGSYTPSSPSPEGNELSLEQQITPAEAALMYVGLSLAAMIILFLFAPLMYCRKQASISKEPPVETEDSNVPEDNLTGYTYVIYTKPNGVKSTDEYSFATAATSQKTMEDTSSKVIYSEVDFEKRAYNIMSKKVS
ncbi:uncharacterized protein LOC129100289 [Anoplopoma fimbria]|uniref:uncharacterized protein LOC129100289 n=1 Tax=Anoplopoma fimbria TaxID=229290 RepID=UPI0023EA997E|nr:uncharacterized protein LOC129100289 [Anoplopoma fimbria]